MERIAPRPQKSNTTPTGSVCADETIRDTLCAMRRQEERGYLVPDYMLMHQSEPSRSTPCIIDVNCRSKMVDWCIRVVDYCQFSREAVSIAVNVVDRFMGTATAVRTKATTCTRSYQLAVMAALYSAVKIHEPQAMSPEILSNISKGEYSVAEIENMELHILFAVKFQVNPPSPQSFLRSAIDLVVANLGGKACAVEALTEIAKIQIEGAVSDYDLARVPASKLTYWSLYNALVTSCSSDDFSPLVALLSVALLGKNTSQIDSDVQVRLQQILMRQTAETLVANTADVARDPAQEQRGKGVVQSASSSCHSSPRSAATTRHL